MNYTTRNGNATLVKGKTYSVGHGWDHVSHQTLTFQGIHRTGVFGSTTLAFTNYEGAMLILCEDSIRCARE